MSWLASVKFWLLLIPTIPSILCSILILIYFYHQRKRISSHQHLTLVLTLFSFLQLVTDFPFVLVYYHYEEVVPASNQFCLWWNWWDYSLSGLLVFIMAWGSIDRHLLVFHNSIMSTLRKRIIYHILPLLICCTYPLIFYFSVIILNSCENEWDYTTLFCFQPCYLTVQPMLALFDFLINIVLPIIVIILANIVLILRVCWQKRNRQGDAARQRKLALQLLAVASLYIIFWFPLTINGILYTFSGSSELGDLQSTYLLYLPCMVPVLLPFFSVPFLLNFKQVVFNIRPNLIGPLTLIMSRLPPVHA
ncbi:hypothetical protein I4U23_018603 [Adineta vaga]|nr:hypothetical protein I4U23_018603 [Adineta vaga]